MAKEIVTTLIDDLTGKDADQTVTYGLDGITYEIDLTDRNAAKLRAALGEFIPVSRRVGSDRVARTPKRANGRGMVEDNRAIRAWAIAQGWEVAPRGRVSAAIISEYRKAH